MASHRLLLATAIAVAAIGSALAASQLHIDFPMDASAKSEVAGHARKLSAADDDDVVCYQGCFLPPVDDVLAVPLPVLLATSIGPMPLLDCYNAAVAANKQNFAILDTNKCYGGDNMLTGWAATSCPLDCVPGGSSPFICGGIQKSSVFSQGYCLRVDAPCAPDEAPATPPVVQSPPPVVDAPPPSSPAPLGPSQNETDLHPPEMPPPPSPAPSPPAGPKKYRCRDKISLWGVNLNNTPVKLNLHTDTQNAEACKSRCDADPACNGYYYKTTGWCYLLGEVYSFSKSYGTSYVACKVVA